MHLFCVFAIKHGNNYIAMRSVIFIYLSGRVNNVVRSCKSLHPDNSTRDPGLQE